MKSPVVIVAITLTAAILVAASLLIFVGTRKGPGTSTWIAPALQHRHHAYPFGLKSSESFGNAGKRPLSAPREIGLRLRNHRSV